VQLRAQYLHVVAVSGVESVRQQSLRIRARTRSAAGDTLHVRTGRSASGTGAASMVTEGIDEGITSDSRSLSLVSVLHAASGQRWSMDAAIPGASTLRRAIANEGQRRRSFVIQRSATLSDR